jgi:hypothetical protein
MTKPQRYGTSAAPRDDGIFCLYAEYEKVLAECERLRETIKRQANAARMGMDAAKAGGAIMLELATQARAESSPEVLASERAMNATLTEEVERLTVDRDHWKANHENQVSRARFLIERGDIPIERVRAYQTFGALLALEEAVRAHRAMYEGTSDEDNMSALSIGDAISQLDAARKEQA